MLSILRGYLFANYRGKLKMRTISGGKGFRLPDKERVLFILQQKLKAEG
jgi:hypothetical protein